MIIVRLQDEESGVRHVGKVYFREGLLFIDMSIDEISYLSIFFA